MVSISLKALFTEDQSNWTRNNFHFGILDDIKVEDDIDDGKSKIDVVNEERISVDAYTTNDKEDSN